MSHDQDSRPVTPLDHLTTEATEREERTWQTPVITRIGLERTLGLGGSDTDGFGGSVPTS
jgi:hypothetical protein